MADTYDVVIIGGGPGGYVAAIRAGQLGLKVALVEKDKRLGGTCLLRGCIPTKSLLRSAEMADMAREAKGFGVMVGEVSVDLAKVHKRKDRVVRTNAGGVSFLMKKNGVDVIQGIGKLAGAGQVEVLTPKDETLTLSTRHVVLATGATPRALPGITIDGSSVLSSDELLELKTLPRHLLVVGAGVVGVEFASVFRSFGAEVTIVEFMDRVLPPEDAEVSAELAKALTRRGIKIKTSTKLTEVAPVEGGLRCRMEPAEGGEVSAVTASHVLIAIGRRPVTEGLGLEGTGVKLARGFIETDGFGRTGEPGVYAIGDIVAGTPQLAHAASSEGVLAIEHIAGLESAQPINYDQVPGCIFSSPEVASVGLTEAAAKARDIEVKVGKFPFSANGKAKVYGESVGFVKIIADAKYHQILGVHIIGPHATDLIAEAGPLLRMECTVEELIATVHAHPTLAEAMHEAAHAVLGHALHM